MPAHTAFTTLAGKPEAQALGTAMEALDPAPVGVGVFEIEDGSGTFEIGAYFDAPPDATALALLEAAFGCKTFAVSQLPDRDWVAEVRRELAPVPAGRFWVHGSHDSDTVPPQKLGICIDAAMAFGTGHHGTTLGCLSAYDMLLKQGLAPRNAVDFGTGTGVLAIAAARSSDAQVTATDMDPIAVATAQANMRANRCGTRVLTLQALGTRHAAIRARAPYDLIFANILANPLKRLAPQFAAVSEPGTIVILSGILNTQSTSVTRVYEGHGFRREHLLRIGEWDSLVLRRS